MEKLAWGRFVCQVTTYSGMGTLCLPGYNINGMGTLCLPGYLAWGRFVCQMGYNIYLNNILLPIHAPTNMNIPKTHPCKEREGIALKYAPTLQPKLNLVP